jgi:hypothetical protein
VTEEQLRAMFSEAMKPDYTISVYENDQDDVHNAALHCDLCSNHTLRRDVWGLLIYTAGPPNTFYRVGTFMSRAEHGDSLLFQNAERRRTVLVQTNRFMPI